MVTRERTHECERVHEFERLALPISGLCYEGTQARGSKVTDVNQLFSGEGDGKPGAGTRRGIW